MTDRPIIFSGPMVRALIAGRKAQTRRLAWRLHPFTPTPWQRVRPGDRLWVRESFAPKYFDDGRAAYRADWDGNAADVVREPKWSRSIHMPRRLSRLTLDVTATRIERLQDISPEDCIAEGVAKRARSAAYPWHVYAKDDFAGLWRSLHGADSWAANPEVVAITFTVHQRNIDALSEAA